MGWWKADPEEKTAESLPTYEQASSRLPTNHPPLADGVSPDSCPVDHQTREIWLQAAQKQRQQRRDGATDDTTSRNVPGQQKQQHGSCPVDSTARSTWLGLAPPLSQTKTPASPPPQPKAILTPPASTTAQCSSDTVSSLPEGPSITIPGKNSRSLSHTRQVSSIPRGQSVPSTSTPSNSEQETGASASGNWIYPSENQFFNAVMRKSTTTTSPEDLAASISSIIPIHNAVNERAWHLIKQWEGDSSKSCGGPKLLSFQGLGAGALSPKAKWNTTVMGAKAPFDRHDWVVERCGGEQVEYIIDFYQGKEREDVDPRRRAQELNFYLDVRPKLNSFEGWKMRAERVMGWR